ncbi:MAG TPA: ATP-binding protein [Candidatus Dormibacteraeota bacterium]|jgi:signal transduction histidine kinase|nr:ATP-binding protein [Candidatus Dormibacteraeota bacterium]
MPQGSQPSRSPTAGLLVGLVLTLVAVLLFAYYMNGQLSGLRALQSNLVDRNRKDSLQLLRVQNDLNSLALAMRDMLDAREPYPLTAWTAQFERIREDLDAALKIEDSFAPTQRTAEQRTYLSQSLAQFWDAMDRMFALAANGRDAEAREQIQVTLQARQAALSTAVSRLLIQNNEGEEQATAEITKIYDRVQRQLYLFLGAVLLVIVLTSLYLIQANKKIFAQLEELSQQRSELAQKLISTQESMLRHLSRELHDEFGQVLTAIGSLLGRAGKQMPENSTLRGDLKEVQEITQSTLNKVRGLSQALHPVLLEEAGLEATLDWYIPTVERQTGLAVSYEKAGPAFAVETGAGVHLYRVVQESLNNISRHAQTNEAWVRLTYGASELILEIEDHGKGLRPDKFQQGGHHGIGMVAMRERAELIGGDLTYEKPEAGGTRVRLRVAREKVEAHGG